MVFSRGQNKESWVQVYSASELEGRRHLDKTLLNCSVALDLRHILYNKQGINLQVPEQGVFTKNV